MFPPLAGARVGLGASRHLARAGLLLFGLHAAIGCGGTASTSTSPSSDAAYDAGGGGAADTGPVGPYACPDAPPAAGSPCGLPYALDLLANCAWGDDPRAPYCRTTALCGPDGLWQVTPVVPSLCGPLLPATCPATPPLDGSACGGETGCSWADGGGGNNCPWCWYGSGEVCNCSPCWGGSCYPIFQLLQSPQWACSAPAAGCPAVAPNPGTPCGTPGLVCSDRSHCDVDYVCVGGVWSWKQKVCPA